MAAEWHRSPTFPVTASRYQASLVSLTPRVTPRPDLAPHETRDSPRLNALRSRFHVLSPGPGRGSWARGSKPRRDPGGTGSRLEVLPGSYRPSLIRRPACSYLAGLYFLK